MLRTLLFVLFSLIHLGCVRVVHSQQGTKQVTRPQITTAGSTTVSDDDYLLDLTLTSSTTTEETETTMNDLSNDYEESNNTCDINNFQFTSYSNKINVSWDDCDSNYNVQITKTVYDSLEIPQFRRLNHTSWYQFKKLEECTAYNISIETDYEFLYRTTIRTFPGKVQNLQMIREDDRLNFNWSMPTSKDCWTRVTVDEQNPRDISVNRYEVPYNLTRCTTVEITLVDNYNNMGEIMTRAVPGIVQDLEVTFESDTIYVTWNKPLDESCVVGYKIALNGETVEEIITETEYTFSDVKPCTQYVVGVAATSTTNDDGEFDEKTGTTETPGTIAAVENLRSETAGNTLQITWNPPALHEPCITSYGIVMWGLSIGTQNDETTDTSFEFSPVVGCGTYNIMVVPKVQQNQGVSKTIEVTIPAIVTDPPTLSSVDTNKISSTVHLRLQSYSTNECSITSITINCTALSTENQPYDWIISEASKQQTHTDTSTRTATVDIENLSPFTNYTCYAYAENSAGISGASDAIKFTTAQEVPSAPQNLTHEEDDDGMLISWEPPEVIPGILRNYKVTMTPIEALHYISENCSISISILEEETTESQLQINGSLPSFVYNITVSASTDAGFGKEEMLTIETNPKAPEAPRDVELELFNKDGETNNVLLLVSWVPPCNSNGRLAYFQWELDGISVVDNDVHNVTGTVTVKSENETLYETEISVKPFFNYTFTLAAYNGDEDNETRGEEYIDTFTSPEGTSGAPEGLQVENITTTGAVIVWEEPTNKNGEILSYRIEITTTGPNHYIPNYCSLYYEPSYNGNTDSDTFLYVFDKGQPNFHYKISIFATTSAGNGSERTLEFDTESDASEEPREVGYIPENVLGEIYNFTATMTWLLPCNTNGNLTWFSWNLEGISLEDSSVYNISERIEPNNDITDVNYQVIIRDLRPIYRYQFSIAAVVDDEKEIIGIESNISFDSPDGIPTKPYNIVCTWGSRFAYVNWSEPVRKNGILQNYRLVITTSGPTYTLPDFCPLNFNTVVYNTTVDPDLIGYSMGANPNFLYTVTVAAATRTGYGPESEMSFATMGTDPQQLDNIEYDIMTNPTETYSSYVSISFDRPCELYGSFIHYSIDIYGERNGIVKTHQLTLDNHATNRFNLDLNPSYTYAGHIDVYTMSGSSITAITNFTAPAGVPPVSNAELDAPILTPTTAALVLSDDLFDDSQGDIIYYAVIVNVGVDVSEGLGGSFDFWERSSWPPSGIWSSTEDKIEYQATPEFWNPFETTRTVNVTYILGDANCSTNPSTYCNGPLRPTTQYAVRVRGFTNNGYRDTSVVHFITPSVETYLALILGLVFGLLAAAVLLFFVFLLWRKKKKIKETKEEEVIGVHAAKPPPIPKNKFAEHCLMFEEDRSQLKAEYSHLERLSASEKSSSNVAMADNNKRKNRYINIMPFDDTRVKLTMDNNDNYDDYINASYIKGYSGNHEYIATQGPMGTTLEDFWRMIVQEDVGIIVMVAQFVEQSKQKCFKYFPEKEEIMNVGCDINVKCTTEANLTDYYTRTLIVEKNGQQKTIKHLQYMLWPDFGCPTNTNSMLEFREIMRKHIENTKNKAIIHCSAGVGRTGTLIAIDILLQKIDNSNDDIDVFGTVLDLRRQRTHMVQTEKQYEYIHKCLRDYLTKPRPISDDNLNPIYENVSIINGYANIPGIAAGHHSTENLIKLKEL